MVFSLRNVHRQLAHLHCDGFGKSVLLSFSLCFEIVLFFIVVFLGMILIVFVRGRGGGFVPNWANPFESTYCLR